MSYGVNAPFGLQPRLHQDGSVWNAQTTAYPLVSGYNQDLLTGDPVYMAKIGTGANQAASIVRAGSGDLNPILGVFMGVKYKSSQVSNLANIAYPYWAAGTTTLNGEPAVALICDDPTVLYDIQVDSSIGTGATKNDLLQNAAVLFNTPGSTATGQSGASLGTISSSATQQLKIIAFTANPNNLPGIQNNNVLVAINNDVLKGGTGTPGITSAAGSIVTNPPLVLSSANILAMNGAPVQVVAAPGAGKAIVVNSFVIQQIVTGTAYVAGGNVGLQYGTTAALGGVPATFALPEAIFHSNSYGPFNFTPSIPADLSAVTVVNQGIFISNDTAAFTTGTSVYDMVITYTIVTL